MCCHIFYFSPLSVSGVKVQDAFPPLRARFGVDYIILASLSLYFVFFSSSRYTAFSPVSHFSYSFTSPVFLTHSSPFSPHVLTSPALPFKVTITLSPLHTSKEAYSSIFDITSRIRFLKHFTLSLRLFSKTTVRLSRVLMAQKPFQTNTRLIKLPPMNIPAIICVCYRVMREGKTGEEWKTKGRKVRNKIEGKGRRRSE